MHLLAFLGLSSIEMTDLPTLSEPKIHLKIFAAGAH